MPIIKKTAEKKSATNKKTTKPSSIKPEKVVKPVATPTEPVDLSKDFNESPLFDVFIYRELFMALRKTLDDLASKRGKSDKDYEAYDDAVYNLIANATSDVGAQDFMGYCYKKGNYDFCILNYEKFMKWTLLAAANGNPFSISKLQIFFANSLNELLSEVEGQSLLLDFLELTEENYYVLIQKMLCEEMVKILNITPENLIKLPEVYQEQTEELTKVFDKTKIEATENVKKTLKDTLAELQERVDKEYKKIQKQEEAEKLKKEQEEKKNQIEEVKVEEKVEEPIPEIKQPKAIKKAPSKQKFRW